MDKPLRVAIFASVSTPSQAQDDKDSLPAQERDGRAWAESADGEVVRIYRVPGHTRKYIDFPDAAAAMEAYRQLDADCKARAFDVLWCRERSRLGRTLALIAAVDERVRLAGAEVYSAKMPHAIGTATDATSTLLAAIGGWAAQSESGEIQRRHHFGMRKRIRRGFHRGAPPTATAPSEAPPARPPAMNRSTRKPPPSVRSRAFFSRATDTPRSSGK